MIYSKEEIANLKQETFAFLRVQEDENVLTITLNRPEKKNAMNPTMAKEIAYALAYAHYNNAVWAVVIDAEGDVFSAGADLKAFASGEKEANNSTIPAPDGEILIGELFINLHKPCIAKVNAPAYAGAFLIICGCTHVFATENASFSLPEVKRGLWPMQVMESLMNIMPSRKVLDLCMRGVTLSGEEALSLGLVTNLVKEDELDKTTNELLSQIITNSPSAIRLGLKAFDELREISDDKKHTYLKTMLFEVLKTQDAMEGIAAFKEKRSPKWTGN